MGENEKRRAGEAEVGGRLAVVIRIRWKLSSSFGSISIESFHLFLALLKLKLNWNKWFFLFLFLFLISFI
jgi:hypothetical protein